MQFHRKIRDSLFRRALLAAAALGGLLFFAGAPSAKAQDWGECNRRAAYADWRYHQAVVHFGFYSPEAGYWRHERFEAFVRLDRLRRYEWRERAWREHEWREYHHHHHHHDWDDDGDRD